MDFDHIRTLRFGVRVFVISEFLFDFDHVKSLRFLKDFFFFGWLMNRSILGLVGTSFAMVPILYTVSILTRFHCVHYDSKSQEIRVHCKNQDVITEGFRLM